MRWIVSMNRLLSARKGVQIQKCCRIFALSIACDQYSRCIRGRNEPAIALRADGIFPRSAHCSRLRSVVTSHIIPLSKSQRKIEINSWPPLCLHRKFGTTKNCVKKSSKISWHLKRNKLCYLNEEWCTCTGRQWRSRTNSIQPNSYVIAPM